MESPGATSGSEEELHQVEKCILLADALSEQYTAPGSFRVNRRTGRFKLGGEESELALAELDRLYTAVWEQLDLARASLAAMQRDTSAYDAIRGGVDHRPYLDRYETVVRRGLILKKFIHARVNLEGITIARQASDMLKSLLPGTDWSAAADRVNLVGEDLDTRTLMQKWGTLIIIVVLIGFVYLLAV